MPGGIPFTEPKNALEIYYNFMERIWFGDDWRTYTDECWINSKGELYKVLGMNWCGMYFRGRTAVEPYGVYPGYEKDKMREVFFYTGPFDVYGMALLSIRYCDAKKLDDMYVYIPALRRTRRLSTAQRDDSPDGSDYIMGDVNGHDDPIGMWSAKIAKTTQMLLPGYTCVRWYNSKEYPDTSKPKRDNKFVRMKYELRPCYIIELMPRLRRGYSRKLIYVDSENFTVLVGEGYDHAGKIWRSTTAGFGPHDEKPEIKFHSYIEFYDHQADHITCMANKPGCNLNVGLKPNDFFEVRRLSELAPK